MTQTADINEVLILIKGSTKPFDVYLYDANDAAENLAPFDQATLAVREEESGANQLLRKTSDATLSISVSASKLIAVLTQVEADALVPGLYVADVALRETSTQKWIHTDRFKVRVVNSMAPHTP